MYSTFFPLALLVLSACGPKEAPEAAPAAAQAEETMKVPDDADSRKFANRLVGLDLKDWVPEDLGAADFRYTTFQFKKDNSWKGAVTLTIIDESVTCTESGSWSMEKADSDNVATVSWTILDTDCPGREKGKTIRGQMTITGEGKVEMLMR